MAIIDKVIRCVGVLSFLSFFINFELYCLVDRAKASNSLIVVFIDFLLPPKVSNRLIFVVSVALIGTHPAISFRGGDFPALAAVSGNKSGNLLCFEWRLIKFDGERGFNSRPIEAYRHIQDT